MTGAGGAERVAAWGGIRMVVGAAAIGERREFEGSLMFKLRGWPITMLGAESRSSRITGRKENTDGQSRTNAGLALIR